MSRTSALGQFTNLPVLADAADITAVGTTMADRIEKYVVMRFATGAARDAALLGAGVTPEQGMQAFLTTPNVLTWYDGTAWRGEWVTSFVPTLSQGASTNIAKTVTKSQYRYDGPMIEYEGALAATAAGTAGSAWVVDLPVPALSATNLTAGMAFIFDAAPATNYVCSPATLSTTTFQFFNDAGAANPVGLTPAITIANGDQIRWLIRYRWV